jgi:hypothetical protein
MARMAVEDSLRSAIDTISRRLQEELEEQLTLLSARQQEELEAARRTAEAEAEQHWAARVDSVRSEWTARLESEVASIREDAERRMVAESMRLRAEAEQATAEATSRVRQEVEQALEQALAQEREQASGVLSTERQQFSSAREELQREIAGSMAQVEAFKQQLESLNAARQQAESTLEEMRRQSEDSARRLDESSAARQQAEAALEEARRAREADAERLERTANEKDLARRALEEAQNAQDEAARRLDESVAARRQAEAALEQERQAREEDAQRLQASASAVAEARSAERQSQLVIVERMLAAIRAMDAARSLSDVLSALLRSAAAEAPRAALFVVNGAELRGWKTQGFGESVSALQLGINEPGLLGEVVRRAEPVVTADGAGPDAPAFAALPADCAAIAVPLLVGAQPVAVLYADDGTEGPRAAPASWPEAVQILGRHASVNLAHLTAARAAEAMRRSLTPSAAAPAAASRVRQAEASAPTEDGNSARRYARLLVSEIKLYNEAAVRLGRQHRDLLARLKPEIDRARRLYEQRISPTIDSSAAFFQQELVQTLADGDPALLGGPA